MTVSSGAPAAAIQGEAVAHGYNPRLHVAALPLTISSALPLIFGLDGGLTPTAVILQHIRGRLDVFAGLFLERGGMRQLCETVLIPWLGLRAAWTLQARGQEILWYIDPIIRTPDASDIDQRGAHVAKRLIGGRVRDGW